MRRKGELSPAAIDRGWPHQAKRLADTTAGEVRPSDQPEDRRRALVEPREEASEGPPALELPTVDAPAL